jgi:hypothetical protein
MQLVLYPTYSSALDSRSAIYAREVCRPSNYYYEALAFNISVAGDYTFWSHSDMSAHGVLYHDDFNPFQPVTNRISSGDDTCGPWILRITHHLLLNTTYVFFFSTRSVGVTGRFSVVSAGPTGIRFAPLGKCEHSSVYTDSCCQTVNIET